ncbi:MAG: hypothetical protein ACTJHC_02210 [Vagococcus sp.]
MKLTNKELIRVSKMPQYTPFSVTRRVAPISATMTIQSVSQPGITNSRANNLNIKENQIFGLMMIVT